MKRLLVLCIVTFALVLFAACGDKDNASKNGANTASPEGVSTADAAKAGFSLIGKWTGVYPDKELTNNMYLFEFNEDGTCSMQLAKYSADLYSCKYYGNYEVSGENLILDLYHGAYETKTADDGTLTEEYHDQGRDKAEVVATVKFQLVHGDVKAFLLIALENARAGKPDGTGDVEKVIDEGLFLVVRPESAEAAPSRYFGEPYLDTASIVPSDLLPKPENLATTNEVNVRSGNGITYTTFGLLPKGTNVTKIATLPDEEMEWSFCLFDYGGGWISSEYIGERAPEEPAEVLPSATP